jgi:hypothetical protein
MSSIDMTTPRESPPCIDLAQLGIVAAAAGCRPASFTAAAAAAAAAAADSSPCFSTPTAK